jgi:hypothetical protein
MSKSFNKDVWSDRAFAFYISLAHVGLLDCWAIKKRKKVKSETQTMRWWWLIETFIIFWRRHWKDARIR